jgi:hypothetical protein
MKSKQFIDMHLQELRDSLPSLMESSKDAQQFIGVFGGVASAIVDAAAALGDEARAYATREVGRILIDFAAETTRNAVAAESAGVPRRYLGARPRAPVRHEN